jgi:hypothetical protein
MVCLRFSIRWARNLSESGMAYSVAGSPWSRQGGIPGDHRQGRTTLPRPGEKVAPKRAVPPRGQTSDESLCSRRITMPVSQSCRPRWVFSAQSAAALVHRRRRPPRRAAKGADQGGRLARGARRRSMWPTPSRSRVRICTSGATAREPRQRVHREDPWRRPDSPNISTQYAVFLLHFSPPKCSKNTATRAETTPEEFVN